jgi:hypothetical protein
MPCVLQQLDLATAAGACCAAVQDVGLTLHLHAMMHVHGAAQIEVALCFKTVCSWSQAIIERPAHAARHEGLPLLLRDPELQLPSSRGTAGRQLLQAYGAGLPAGAYALGLLHAQEQAIRNKLLTQTTPGTPTYLSGYGHRTRPGSYSAYGA